MNEWDKAHGNINVLGVTGFASTFHGRLVLAQVNESRGKTRPIGDAGEKELGGLVQLILETLLSDLKNVCDIGHTQEVLHVMQTVRLSIGIGQFRVNLGLAKGLASHLEEPDEIIVFTSVVRDLDDLGIVGGILSLDVRI